MSRENVEVVLRRSFEAFERGDRAAWLAEFDGKVLVRVHQQARSAGSRVPMDFDTWFVYTVMPT
jgi:hypothetical protein